MIKKIFEMDTISNKLNYIPYRCVDTQFEIWFSTYIFHITNLFNIFLDELHDVEPFSKKIYSRKTIEEFAKYLYKKSSRII